MVTNVLEKSLEQDLAPFCTQEFLAMAIDSVRALANFGYSDHELELINALEAGRSEEIVSECYRIFERHLLAVCKMHRLVITEGPELGELARFVDALWLMQDWGDGRAIVDICNADAMDVEKLAALVKLVGTLSENEVLDMVLDVDSGFMAGLSRIYTENSLVNLEDEPEPLDPDHLERIRQWSNLMGAQKSLGIRMARSGFLLGQGFAHYLKGAAHGLSSQPNEAIASEVCSLLVISRDGWHSMLMTWREHSALLDLEPHHINSIDAKIAKLSSQFEQLRGMKK